MGCKVPTDILKINGKEVMHMGLHYINTRMFNLTERSNPWTDFTE